MDEAESTYTFRCRKCHQDHDVNLTRGAFVMHEARCPACGSTDCRRHIALPADALTAGAIAAERQQAKYPFVSSRLPFKLNGAQHVGPLGRNVVTSKSHYAELCRQADFKPGQG